MQNLKSTSDALSSCQRKLAKLTIQHNLARENVRQERQRLKEAKAKRLAAEEAQQVAQHVAQAIQQQAHKRIAEVVTRCLHTVFGENAYDFDIQFERKRGKTEALLRFLKDGKERHPLRASGGGFVDIASLALRLSCIMLSKPKSRRLLVLDEPVKNVHGEEYRLRTAELLQTLAKEMNVQIIMTTGFDWLKIGQVVEVE